MFPFIRFSKVYNINNSIAEAVDKLNVDSLESVAWNLRSEFVNAVPPTFEFSRPISSFPPLSKPFKTILIATLIQDNTGTRVLTDTKTNPILWIVVSLFVVAAIINFFKTTTYDNVSTLVSYLLVIVIMVVVDGISKSMLVARFKKYLCSKVIQRTTTACRQ